MKKSLRNLLEYRSQILIIAIILCASTLFVYFLSYSTSPWVSNYWGGDSAQFQTIGKAWAQGKIPYKDMFDHKGPIIFFIDMLGYLLVGTSSGIMIFQIISLSVTCYFIYLISKLAKSGYSYGIIQVILFLVLLANVYSGGNLTEEYCLPFITMSLYFFMRYFYRTDNNEISSNTHNPLYALIYGVAFGVCLMTKLSNAIIICAGVLIIIIVLIKNKQWKNLIKNALTFIIGAAIVVLPFAIYFYVQGVFSEFIYASIGYNFEYQSNMTSWLFGGEVTGTKVRSFFNCGFPFYTLFITAFLARANKHKHITYLCVLLGLLELYLYLSGALYTQYYIFIVPQITLLLNELYLFKCDKKEKNFIRDFLIGFICVFCYSRFVDIMPNSVDMHNNYKDRSEVYESLLDEIPAEEKDSFVAWGGNEFKELYLMYDLTPCYKYHLIQTWHASFSEETKEDMYNIYKSGEAKWILVNTEVSTEIIQDVLDEYYEKVDSVDAYVLYQRTD